MYVMNNSRGSTDLRSNGMKVCVRICVPVVLTFHDLFHALRMVKSPEYIRGSNWPPWLFCGQTVTIKNYSRFDRFEHPGVVDQDIHPVMLLQNKVKGLLD